MSFRRHTVYYPLSLKRSEHRSCKKYPRRSSTSLFRSQNVWTACILHRFFLSSLVTEALKSGDESDCTAEKPPHPPRQVAPTRQIKIQGLIGLCPFSRAHALRRSGCVGGERTLRTLFSSWVHQMKLCYYVQRQWAGCGGQPCSCSSRSCPLQPPRPLLQYEHDKGWRPFILLLYWPSYLDYRSPSLFQFKQKNSFHSFSNIVIITEKE